MPDAIPLTGPEAIKLALSRLDLAQLEKEQRDVITKKKKTARPRAVRVLRILDGLKRNGITPDDFMLHSVPVIPPRFRPFSITGNTFEPGDANEHYRTLMEYRRLYNETEKQLGRAGSGEVYDDLQKAVNAVYGYGESPNPKTAARGVKGFFQVISGTSPKTGYVQSKMLGKPVDTVGRGVIIPDADLGMNEVGIPREMAWKSFASYVQRRLVQSGMSAGDALKHVKNRTTQAQKALETEIQHRPVIVTRSPAWHKFNTTGAWARLIDGDAIKINTYISDGHNADFDGDTMSMHVPSTPEAVNDVKERLMPDKMLFSIKDRSKVVPVPKHEQVLGLYDGATGASQRKHTFATEDEAMHAIRSGKIDLSDEIEIGSPAPDPLAGRGAQMLGSVMQS